MPMNWKLVIAMVGALSLIALGLAVVHGFSPAKMTKMGYLDGDDDGNVGDPGGPHPPVDDAWQVIVSGLLDPGPTPHPPVDDAWQ